MSLEELITLISALLIALINLIGIFYNHNLSKKLKSTEEESSEKRKLRNKIQDRLAEFEEQFLNSLDFSKNLSQRFIYLARNVKIYNHTLSVLIRIFVQDWKKWEHSTDGKSVREPTYKERKIFNELINMIGDQADELLANLSIGKKLKIVISWLRFRIKMFCENLDQSRRQQERAPF